MKPNEIHEIHWSLGQIEGHIAGIHQFLRSDPNYRPMARRKFQGKKKMPRRKAPPSSSDKDWNKGCQNKRRRKAKRNKGKQHSDWFSVPDNEQERKPKVKIIYPSDDASVQIGTKYARIPVGDKWVHAGCSVFVPRKVYKYLELVRKALSDRMDTLIQADLSEEW